MAVTIGEVQVDVTDERPEAAPAQSAAAPQQRRTDLASALERVRERRERLKAD